MRALTIPLALLHQVCQIVLLPIYVLAAWRCGCTYAPRTDPLWKVLRDTYQERAASADEQQQAGGGAWQPRQPWMPKA